MHLIQHYVMQFVSYLQQVGGFLWVLLFLPPIKLTATIFNRKIVESGIKHHNPNHYMYNLILLNSGNLIKDVIVFCNVIDISQLRLLIVF